MYETLLYLISATGCSIFNKALLPMSATGCSIFNKALLPTSATDSSIVLPLLLNKWIHTCSIFNETVLLISPTDQEPTLYLFQRNGVANFSNRFFSFSTKICCSYIVSDLFTNCTVCRAAKQAALSKEREITLAKTTAREVRE